MAVFSNIVSPSKTTALNNVTNPRTPLSPQSGPSSFMIPQSFKLPTSTQSPASHTVTTTTPDGTTVTHKQTYATDTGIKTQPAATSTGSYLGSGSTGTPVPDVGSTEYNQAYKNSQGTLGGSTPSSTTQTAPQSGLDTNRSATSGLLNLGTKGSDEINRIAQEQANLKAAGANTQSAIAFEPGKTLDTKLGVSQSVAQTQAAKEAALASELSAAQTGQGQQITALGNAATATAPTSVNYGTQYGTPQDVAAANQSSGGTSIQPGNPFYSTLQQYAQMAVNGQLSQIPSSVTSNPVLNAQLNQMAKAINPNYNPTLSEASGKTQATGQALQAAASSANKALDSLQTSFNSLGGAQTGGIPLTNSIANWIGSKLGQAALTSYKTNLADARSQLVGVLNTSGGTPTGNEATAEAYLPDDMTVGQFNQNVGTPQNPGIVRQLIQQKVGSFTESGSNSSSQNSGFTEGQASADGKLVYRNGQWTVK